MNTSTEHPEELRNWAICVLRNRGWVYRDIAEDLAMTFQRVEQVYKRIKKAQGCKTNDKIQIPTEHADAARTLATKALIARLDRESHEMRKAKHVKRGSDRRNKPVSKSKRASNANPKTRGA